MKQLNDTAKGYVIAINKIRSDSIVYTIYENANFRDNNLFGITKVVNSGVDKTYIPTVLMSIADAEYEAALLKVQSIETNYIINEDINNWYIQTGSTNMPTTIRVVVTNKAYDIALANRDNTESEYYGLWQVLFGVQSNLPTTTSQITYNGLVQYLEEIYPESKAVLDYYIENYSELGIAIEYKNE